MVQSVSFVDFIANVFKVESHEKEEEYSIAASRLKLKAKDIRKSLENLDKEVSNTKKLLKASSMPSYSVIRSSIVNNQVESNSLQSKRVTVTLYHLRELIIKGVEQFNRRSRFLSALIDFAICCTCISSINAAYINKMSFYLALYANEPVYIS